MTLDERICDAEDKLHALQTGTAAVQVDVGEQGGGYRTMFNRVDVQKLEAYIARLKAERDCKPTIGAVGFVL